MTRTSSTLDQYNRKRNFSDTPEPMGKRARRSKALRFVVQKHAASHLHYDFRLELDGTLKSWAIPKGPSLDPKQKRLAVQVEDHPIDYADFEGVIPAGNYGAGTVIVWDNGEWQPLEDPVEGYRKGKLKFALHGKKLTGIWNLVRSQGFNNKSTTNQKSAWLLIKHNDEAARAANAFNVVDELPDSVLGGNRQRSFSRSQRAPHSPAKQPSSKPSKSAAGISLPTDAKKKPMPLILAPQLATLVDSIPGGDDWLYEIKFDGYRILTRIDAGAVKLFTRNGNDWTAKLPHLAKSLQKLAVENAWLDGEIIVMDDRKQANFQQLQNAFENSATDNIQYYLFDLLYLNGHDLSSSALHKRRTALESLIATPPPAVFYSQNFDLPAAELFEHVCNLQLEGLIGKRADSNYYSGRSRDWIKLKCLQRQEFVIVGYTDPTGSRTGTFGALLLGYHDSKSGELRYAGRVGTGFTQTSARELIKKMLPLQRQKAPIAEFTDQRSSGIHWLKPTLIGEVAFSAWTNDGLVRHASFQGLRSDKPSSNISIERAISIEAPAAAKTSAQSRAKKSTKRSIAETPSKDSPSRTKSATPTIAGVAISHGERIIDPGSNITKAELSEYYAQVGELMLPHLADRPVSLVRAPAGIDGPHFFQKHLNGVKIPHIRQLDVDLYPEHPPLIAIDSVAALVNCAQMNVVEFHTWNSTTFDMVHPDRIIFDLDPGEGIKWPQIQQATLLTKTLLDELKLKSFLKTSGGKGLHIVVPLQPLADWETVKNFSHAVVQHLANTLPTLFVAKNGPKNRVKRIFVDYLRNGFGATTACAFSARLRTGLGVSVPIPWQELDVLKASAQWTIRDLDAIKQLAKNKPWKNYAVKQNLTKAMHILSNE